MQRTTLISLLAALVLAATSLVATATAAGDPFLGAWRGVDPDDGSALRLQIGGSSASGVRHVTVTDGFASACGAAATAIGTGTVSGSTLTAVVDVRCGGEAFAEDVTIALELAGDTLTDGYSTFTRPGA